MNTQHMTNQLSDDAFARLVADEVKNKVAPQRRAILTEPENWDRWKRALLALVDNLERQIDSIKADAESDHERYSAMGSTGAKLAKEASASYDQKKTRVEKFLFHVNRRLDEVMKMIETGDEVEQSPWHIAETYRRAIMMHRSLMEKHNLEPTSIDSALWAVLDRRWELDDVVFDDE